MIDNTILQEITPVFSGHETFPIRYGWLKKVYDACIPIDKNKGVIARDLFNKDDAIVTLGVGKNMVSSMRHWSVYTSLFDVDEKTKNLSINDFARELFDDDGFDPWLENYATLWYIHWNLAAKKNGKNHLYTYLWFFNILNGNTFEKDVLVTRIMESLNAFQAKKPSPSTLKRDVDCFLGVYSSRTSKNKADEDAIESPLTELELIHPLVGRTQFQINRGIKPTISVYTFLFALLKFWNFYSPNTRTISFESICYNFMSPGRMFLLNEDAVSEYLQQLSDVTNNNFIYTETAGMKQIINNSGQEIDFDTAALHYFRGNYT